MDSHHFEIKISDQITLAKKEMAHCQTDWTAREGDVKRAVTNGDNPGSVSCHTHALSWNLSNGTPKECGCVDSSRCVKKHLSVIGS